MRLALLFVIVFALSARAERPPQFRKDAEAVIVGTVQKVTTKEAKFGGDGVMTYYTATVKVEKAEKGDAKEGDTIEVKWFEVTKNPTRPLPGAYGHKHVVKAKDRAKFWLMGTKSPWTVIYNRDGVEKVK